MSAHAIEGRRSHAAPRRWFGLRRRHMPPVGDVNPPGDYPYVDLSVAGALAALTPAPSARFSGSSAIGLPDTTGEFAAILAGAEPGEAAPETPRDLLRHLRDGLRTLDEPLAFLRRGGPDGGFGRCWDLSGEPRFVGAATVKGTDRRVAEVVLGQAADGSDCIIAGDRQVLDAWIAMLITARDRLVYAVPPAEADPADAAVPETPADTDARIFSATRVYRLSDRTRVAWPDDPAAREEIEQARVTLLNTLDLYSALVTSIAAPLVQYPELEGEDDPRGAAMDIVSLDASAAAKAVADVVARHSGQAAADYISDKAASETAGEVPA